MPKITYITHDGAEHSVDATVGISVMSAAIDNGVPGIVTTLETCNCSDMFCEHVNNLALGQSADHTVFILAAFKDDQRGDRQLASSAAPRAPICPEIALRGPLAGGRDTPRGGLRAPRRLAPGTRPRTPVHQLPRPR